MARVARVPRRIINHHTNLLEQISVVIGMTRYNIHFCASRAFRRVR